MNICLSRLLGMLNILMKRKREKISRKEMRNSRKEMRNSRKEKRDQTWTNSTICNPKK